MNELWTRAAAGLDTAWLGGPLPRIEGDLAPLRVHCDPPTGPLGPLLEARDRARRALGDRTAPLPARGGLGRRLLDGASVGALEEVVEALNDLAGVSGRRRVLVFEGLEAADQGTLAGLDHILRRRGWLKLPLVLGVRSPEGRPELATLLATLAEVAGPEALLQAPREAAPTPIGLTPERLPASAARVLRAAALVGEAFTAELVGALLERPPTWVLERLQVAADHGWPLADDGEGHLRMPAGAVRALRGSLLPSLARAWHLRLAQVRQEERRVEVPQVPEIIDQSPDPGGPVEAPAEAAPPSREPAFHAEPPGPADDPAAAHLLAAGEVERAIDQLIAATRQAAELGAAAQALSLGGEGLRRLDELPPSEAQRRRRAALLIALARAQHVGGFGPRLTLAAARETIEAAAQHVRPEDPLDLQVDLGVVRSGILYDIGANEDLEQALAELTDLSKRLEAAGAPVEAARLFNDQAAIWVRLGDPVRAHGLLTASRRIFAEHAARDPRARLEQAETDLLIARLPLHVAARPGRESEAATRGLEHAQAAEVAFNQLGLARSAARARETQGRLELLRGRTREAIAALQTAARAQQKLGDALGLASTVEALARALSAEGQHEAALELVGESLGLNVEKGSIRGAAYVRQALEGVVGNMPPPLRQKHAAVISRLSSMLADQEARLKGWDGGD